MRTRRSGGAQPPSRSRLRRYEAAVLAVSQQVGGSADAVGENERQPARGCLVHDDTPRLT